MNEFLIALIIIGGCAASSALSANFPGNPSEFFINNNNNNINVPSQWFCMTEKEADFIVVNAYCCKDM